jgi:formylglycine-generating enzyme required for sulfatase activity
MHGNAWEWCWDWYGDYPSGAQIDPMGASTGTNRVIRGGSWYGNGQYLRSALRDIFTPSLSNINLSFRLLLPSSEAEQALETEGFVEVNGGSFMMGSPVSEEGRYEDEVQHRVTVSSFYMGKNQVTVGEFRRFVNATGYKTTAETSGDGYVWSGGEWEMKADANWKNPYFSQQDNQPVVLVSWYDAVNYCNWRSQQESLTAAYTVSGTDVTWNRGANGYRLPTEAEWEYACRAGTTTPFSTGGNITTDQANYYGLGPYNGNAKGTYRGTTTAVGSFAANQWGLYDMHGNVYEWCWDWYGTYPSGSQTDPMGASSGTGRVLRGGGWLAYGHALRSALRDNDTPSSGTIDLGFRLLRPSL